MEEWEKLKSVDVRTVGREDLIDIAGLSNENADSKDRALQMKVFMDDVKNPYCFKVGEVVVKSSFIEGVSLNQRLREMADGIWRGKNF